MIGQKQQILNIYKITSVRAKYKKELKYDVLFLLYMLICKKNHCIQNSRKDTLKKAAMEPRGLAFNLCAWFLRKVYFRKNENAESVKFRTTHRNVFQIGDITFT